MPQKEREMTDVKKNICVIAACVLLFCADFACGYLFNGIGNTGNQAGVAADVRGYDEAAKRIENAAGAVADVTRNVSEAAGAVRINIDDAGSIREIAGDIGKGAVIALDGIGRIEGGIRIIGIILDEAEKRNAEMEEHCGGGLD